MTHPASIAEPPPKTASGHAPRKRSLLRLVLEDGGPGMCQFAINNACNAKCGFCSFALDKLPRDTWKFVDRDQGLQAIDILARQDIGYLLFTGGEPLMHPHILEFAQRGRDHGMKVMLVTHAGLLRPERIRELAGAGVSSFIISVDAASEELHERNRGLPGVCAKIREANKVIKELRLYSTASVTMSKLVDYDALPDFLRSLGFTSVTFSYPLNHLGSSFLGFSDADLVNYTDDELLAAFEKVKAFKKRFLVLNPTASLEEMQRFVRKEEQRFPCLGGYKYFHLDWNLDLWRCHYWHKPMCSIFEFDGSQRIRDGCTKCMIDCYRDSSTMHHIGMSVSDAYRALKAGRPGQAVGVLATKSALSSLRSILEELPWLLRF
jgi:MoaA/NifB/PqqE/SkfB family radical SAM enzyme